MLLCGWLSGPILFSGQVGISAYTWTVFERDTYHPVSIWHPPLRHPRMFKGKVGSKVNRKRLSSAGHATGPSLRGSLGLGARQDKSRHRPTSKVSWSVLHSGTVHPPPHARQQDTYPLQTNGPAHSHPTQDWLLWASEESVSSLSAASPTAAPSPGACSVLSTSMGPGPRGTKGEPSSAGSTTGIQGIRHPASSS